MKQFENIRRRAILIGCPGTKPHLPGVQKDLMNMRKFLQSNKGGSWDENEIVTLTNPSESELMRDISCDADYSFVYFSGHGATNARGDRLLALRDLLICDTALLNESPRQLIIVDACRTPIVGLAGAPSIIRPDLDHFEEYSTEELFLEQIALSPNGKIIVHATRSGVSAGDTPQGGVFTRAFLNLAQRMVSDSDYTPCSIKSILKFVPKETNAMRNIQHPEVVFSSGNLTVPFAFSLSTIEKIADQQFDRKLQPSISPLIGLGALVLLIVCIVAASE